MLSEIEPALHEKGQQRGRHCSCEYQPQVIQANTGENGLAIAAGADECP
jgi:hypothetical protein